MLFLPFSLLFFIYQASIVDTIGSDVVRNARNPTKRDVLGLDITNERLKHQIRRNDRLHRHHRDNPRRRRHHRDSHQIIPISSYSRLVDYLSRYQNKDLRINEENQMHGLRPNTVNAGSMKNGNPFQYHEFHHSPMTNSAVGKGKVDNIDSSNRQVFSPAEDGWQLISRTKAVGLLVGVDNNFDNLDNVHTGLSTKSATEFLTAATTPSFIAVNTSRPGVVESLWAWGSAPKKTVSFMVRETPLWIGLAVGMSISAAMFFMAMLVSVIVRKHRSRLSNVKELSIGSPKADKPIYIKLSQLHRPKCSPNYIVTVLDESSFSTAETDGSDDELFNLRSTNNRPYRKQFTLDKQNLTTTVKKNNQWT